MSTTYYLKDPSFEFTTLPETIVSKGTAFDCGPYSIVFFNINDNSPVDSTIFDVDSFSFRVLFTEDLSVVGEYTISYKVFFTNYPTGPIFEQTVPFTINIADPCKTTTLAFTSPVPYVSTTYYLKDPSFEFKTLPETIVSKGTAFDCGPYSIVFFNTKDNSPVDRTIFDVDSFSFRVRYTESLSVVGDYNISFKISFKNYPPTKYPTAPVLTQTVPFTIKITDPCKTTTSEFIDPVANTNKTQCVHDPSFDF